MSRAEVFVIGYLNAANINKDVDFNAMDLMPEIWAEGYRAYNSLSDFLKWGAP